VVEAAIARGYAYVALTDHSRSLQVARGLAVERVREQRRLIDGLNVRYAPFQVLHGTEVDILPDGSLDYPDELLAELDLVTASVHSALNQPREQMTARLVRALRNPYVDVLNHPSGRLLPRRPEYEVDLEVVLRAAAAAGVAVEVNGQPDRLDLDDVWARRANELGALLTCDSDAHSARQLDYVRYAVITARRGWAGPRDVLNTLPLDRLRAHLALRRARARAA
jgi:DNA polymerase (family 10)